MTKDLKLRDIPFANTSVGFKKTLDGLLLTVLSGNKVHSNNFCSFFFIRTQNYNAKTFVFSGRCSKVLNFM